MEEFKVEPIQPMTSRPVEPVPKPSMWAGFRLPPTKWLVVGSVVILLAAVIFFLVGRGSFGEGNVELKIEGPTEISSGDLVTYKLLYKNGNKVDLSDVKISFFYPLDAIVVRDDNIINVTNEVVEVGELGSGDSGEKELMAYIIGDRGNIKTARAIITFRPESVSSLLEKETTLNTTITDLAVPITLVAPPTVINGQAVSYIIDYRNQSDQDIENLRFLVKYPFGFNTAKLTPPPSARESNQDVWDVKMLKQGDGSRITIDGLLNGSERETKTVTVTLQRKITTPDGDVYIDFQKSEATSVISSPLMSVGMTVNGSNSYTAHLNDNLRYKINFSNNTNFDINNLTLSVKLEGSMYDFSTVKTNGFFDSRLNTVFWNGSALPELNNLRPNQSGAAEFDVKLKSNFEGAVGARDSFVKASVHLETPNVPPNLAADKLTADDQLITRISTSPTFSQNLRINDSEWGSSGPFPPKVDQKSVFTLNWKLVNPGNDMSPAKLTATLAPGVSWENRVRVNGSQPQPVYNDQQKTVTWDFGSLPAGVGVNFPEYEAYFQLSITPSVNQVGQTVDLLRSIRFEGTDIFTKENIVRTIRDIDSGDVTDSSQNGNVQP